MPEQENVAAPEPDDFIRIGEDGVLRRMLRFDGELRSLSEWGRLYGISKFTLNIRLKSGWTIERAITTPTQLRTKPARVIREIRRQIDPEKIKPADRTSPEMIRLSAKAVKQRLGKLNSHEQLLKLEKEYGERKFEACKRLRQEQRYELFRTRCRAYSAATKSLEVSRHIIFYLALEDFPPIDSKG